MLAPSPDQKKFTDFCKTWDALSEMRREEFVRLFAADIRELLGVEFLSSKIGETTT
jgi:hypothetical protein